MTRSHRLPPATLRKVRAWSALWGVPDLADTVEIAFSERLRSSLGRCAPARGRIRLNVRLLDDDRARLRDVLCHELAHVAAFRLHGSGVAPHGEEWRALVEAAGFTPSVRACVVERSRRAGSDSGGASTNYGPGQVQGHTGGKVRFAHRCPVCQTVRYARGPVRPWRCAACLAAGLDGVLEITSEPVRGS